MAEAVLWMLVWMYFDQSRTCWKDTFLSRVGIEHTGDRKFATTAFDACTL
eukprot:m.1640520 g.1640520  ORF g.1640520 m.1640520 type:complete len:50 (+) comp42185_c0_seq1:316-465(+)